MGAAVHEPSERVIDRYAIYEPIAAGGMAVVHFGRLLGQAGFSRTVAIKRLHPQFAADPEFVAMFLDEARLAVRVQHPNVVSPLDVVVAEGELLVVMDYVSGETLAQLMRQAGEQLAPVPVIGRVLADALYGLHAAHEAVAEDGSPLEIVHRDVSPQNVIVGVDGVTRVLDFGVAKAAMRSHATKEGEIKGKLAYMPPEQLKSLPLDRRTDLFAAGIVLWECLTGQRLFRGDDLGQTVERVLHSQVGAPSRLNPAVPPALDAVVLRALERDPAKRFQTAREQAGALEAALPLANAIQVADWVRALGGPGLSKRIERVAAIESRSSSRLRVQGRTPQHTPLGLTPLGLPLPMDFASNAKPPTSAPGADERATVRPGGEPPASAVAPQAPTPVSGKRFKLLLGGVLVSALAAGALLSSLGRSAAMPAASTSSVALAPTPGTASAKPEAAPEPATEPLVGEPASPAASRSPSKRDTLRAVTRAAPVKAAIKKPAASCSPPYSVDERGIRRIKPECR